MHCNGLRLVLGLGLVRVSSRVRVSVMVRFSIRTSWVVNFALSLLAASNLHSSPLRNAKKTGLWDLRRIFYKACLVLMMSRQLRRYRTITNRNCLVNSPVLKLHVVRYCRVEILVVSTRREPDI